ncbi:solute carrier family 35 member C2-like isoform X1 [Chelonus insularis]|uniref:solute carrier family 35 member C2-like isoform X1 n=1 Tax=Chelonus insularis TaxID=460826 RepID=UPI00158C569A|nr:solute carrier family 35 member C2-like isoform X1 [Chelonus insularis]XP_034941815.1 solute carrier family 35 member C2-like isoform X1 [Chelonus insularis]
MPRTNVKYEIARDDPDSMDCYLQHAQEYQATKIHKSFWNTFGKSLILIATYFILSVGLISFQQWFLKDHGFHYPLGVVICHLLVKLFLAAFIRNIRSYKRGQQQGRLSWQNILSALAPPGIASGLDIGFSNWAISLITLSLYTMTKSTSIIFILGFALMFKLEKKSWSLVGVVVMISGGLIMFTYKSTQFHVLGFSLCLLASLCSGLRWTMAQLIMQKSKLGLSGPIDMMYYMQPWMLIAIIPMALWFEGEKALIGFRSIDWNKPEHAIWSATAIFIGAILAFNMEVMEFMVVTYTSSLTLAILNILKEICMLVLAFEWKGDEINSLNFFGLLLCLGGILLHAIQKVLLNKKEITENLELHSESITTVGSSVDDGHDTNIPLLNQRSTSLNNLLHSNFSTDEEDDSKDKDDSSEILFNILQRREQT